MFQSIERQNQQQAQNRAASQPGTAENPAANTAERQQAQNEQNRQNAENQQAKNAQEDGDVDPQNTAAISEREARDDANMAVAAGSSREVPVTVGDIKAYDIVGADGNELGDIDKVVNVGDRLYAVVTSGGFLGLGENRAAVPLSVLYVTDEETLLAPNVTEQQIDGMPNFQDDQYSELPDEQSVTLGGR